ncbi:hypothetical protein Btru_025510 [Bulinus truncatus]|nr:hypothetical protein Btru_025510 [Bulinus truncatus]
MGSDIECKWNSSKQQGFHTTPISTSNINFHSRHNSSSNHVPSAPQGVATPLHHGKLGSEPGDGYGFFRSPTLNDKTPCRAVIGSAGGKRNSTGVFQTYHMEKSNIKKEILKIKRSNMEMDEI